MMLPNVTIILLSVLAVLKVTGGQSSNTPVIDKEFVSSLPDTGRQQHNYLRRDLQYGPCRAVNLVTSISNEDCSGTYPCVCRTIETLCTYCEVVTTPEDSVCLVTGASITFVAPDTNTMTTCMCEFVRGEAVQICHESLDDRAEPEPGGTGDPIPISTPQATLSPGSLTHHPDDTAAPQYTLSPIQPVVATCRADNPITIIANDCSGTYPCTCIGSTETSCTYCELDTTRGHYCQTSGSTVTFVDRVTSLLTTCSCAYTNGVAIKSCHHPTTISDPATPSYQSSPQTDIDLPTEENVVVVPTKKTKLHDTWTDLP